MRHMRRREFITLFCGTAATWPVLARAQQAMPAIGVISAGERDGFVDLLAATRLGLKDLGFVEGQNFEFAYAFAGGRFDELRKLASDLVRQRDVAPLAANPEPTPVASPHFEMRPVQSTSPDAWRLLVSPT